MDDTLIDTIRQLAEPILSEKMTELVDLALFSQGNQVAVRMLVDKAGGVTIQDCTFLNRRISSAIEQSGALGEDYTVEVSSPGLDRPLASRRDFERAIGEEVCVYFKEPVDGMHQIEGMVLSVQEAAVVINNQKNTTVALSNIAKAKKKIKW
jgi:ribosome maturation factor RimP